MNPYNPQDPSGSSRNLPTPPPVDQAEYPGQPYGTQQPNGFNWFQDADTRWWQDHRLNPETGLVEGPFPYPPAGVGRQVQSFHEQAIWRYRQNLMQRGIGYAQGALGLLQSYRPGGGATLEAGQYNTLAGLQFERAAQTQPLDYLADVRRDDAARIQQAANRANDRQTAVQIGTAVASLAVGLAGGGAALGALGSMASATQAAMGRPASGNGAYAMDPTYVMDRPQQQSNGYGSGYAESDALVQQFEANRSQGGQAPQGPQPAAQPPQMGGQPGAAMPAQIQQQGTGAGGVPQGQPAPNAPGGVDAPGGFVGMGGGMAPGVTGDFSGTAYAAGAAGSPAYSSNPMGRVYLTDVAADLYEQDPFYQTFGAAINARWRERLLGGAA